MLAGSPSTQAGPRDLNRADGVAISVAGGLRTGVRTRSTSAEQRFLRQHQPAVPFRMRCRSQRATRQSAQNGMPRRRLQRVTNSGTNTCRQRVRVLPRQPVQCPSLLCPVGRWQEDRDGLNRNQSAGRWAGRLSGQALFLSVPTSGRARVN